MRKSLKIIKRVALVLAGLLFLFYIVLFYRSNWAYKHTGVAAKATAVLKINVDKIAVNYVFHKLIHPGSSSGNDAEKDSISSALSIPSHVFVYTVADKDENTFFTSIPVSDTAIVHKYLIDKFGFTQAQPFKGLTCFQKEDNTFQVAYSNERIMLAYAPSKEKVTDVFESVLLKNEVIDSKSALWGKVKEAAGDLAWVTPTTNIAFSLQAGSISFSTSDKYSFKSNKGAVVNKTALYVKDATNAVFASIQQLPEKAEPIKLKNHTLVYDSVAKYTNAVQLCVKGSVMQTDKKITYEYNDDFEKVAVETLVEKEVPNIQLTGYSGLGNAQGLLTYLTNAGIITNGVVSSEVFPLYQLYTNSTQTAYTVSTNVNAVAKPLYAMQYPFYLYVNFNQLVAYTDLSMLQNKVDKLQDLEVTMQPTDNGAFVINGVLQLKDSNMHPIKMLLR